MLSVSDDLKNDIHFALSYATDSAVVRDYMDGVWGYPYTYPLLLSMTDEGASMISYGIFNDRYDVVQNGINLLCSF